MESLMCVLFFKVVLNGIEVERSERTGFVLEVKLKALLNHVLRGEERRVKGSTRTL